MTSAYQRFQRSFLVTVGLLATTAVVVCASTELDERTRHFWAIKEAVDRDLSVFLSASLFGRRAEQSLQGSMRHADGSARHKFARLKKQPL